MAVKSQCDKKFIELLPETNITSASLGEKLKFIRSLPRVKCDKFRLYIGGIERGCGQVHPLTNCCVIIAI